MSKQNTLLPLGGELSLEEVTPTVETALVKDAIAGDKDAFSQLFRLTYRQMFYVARKILWQDEDIYDALQIAYTKAYKYMDRVKDPEKFVAWLSRIVENAAKDVYKEVYQHSAEALDDEPAAPDTTEDTERRADIRDALQSLPVEQAEVLSLYYYDGLTLAEIAKLLNISMAAAYRRLGAAKKCLLKELEVRGIDRNVYGGGVFAAIAVAFRSAIGTDILSATVAQQMLDNVLTGKQTRLTGAAASLVMQKRNRAVLRIASMLLAFCLLVTTATTLLALWLSGSLTPPPATTPQLPEWIWTSTSTTASTTTTTPAPSSGETSGPSSSSETISTATTGGSRSTDTTASTTTTGGSRSTNTTASTTTTTNTATAPSGSSSSSTTTSTAESTTTTTYTRSEQYVSGTVENGVYVNTWAGMKMTIPGEWRQLTSSTARDCDLFLYCHRMSGAIMMTIQHRETVCQTIEDYLATQPYVLEHGSVRTIGGEEYFGYIDDVPYIDDEEAYLEHYGSRYFRLYDGMIIEIYINAPSLEEVYILLNSIEPI